MIHLLKFLALTGGLGLIFAIPLTVGIWLNQNVKSKTNLWTKFCIGVVSLLALGVILLAVVAGLVSLWNATS